MNKLRYKMDLAARFLESKAETFLAMYLRDQLKELETIWDGLPYMASTYYVPGELLASFDLPTIYIERMTGFGAASQMVARLEAWRETSGLPPKACSYQLFFSTLIREGFIPPPMGFISASFACDDARMYGRWVAAQFKIPFFEIDVLQSLGEKGNGYLSAQLERVYQGLRGYWTECYSRAEIVEYSNQALELKRAIDRMRIAYPGLLGSNDSLKLFTIYNQLGRPSTVEIFQELSRTLQLKTSEYQLPKGARILWLGVVPLYRNQMIREIEQRYDCRVVHEELFDYGEQYLTEEHFFDDLAARIIQSGFFSVSQRIKAIQRYVELLEIDGVIHFSQRNCRFLPPLVPVLQTRLTKLGIPLVEVEGDVIDPDYFNAAECFGRLDQFFNDKIK